MAPPKLVAVIGMMTSRPGSSLRYTLIDRVPPSCTMYKSALNETVTCLRTSFSLWAVAGGPVKRTTARMAISRAAPARECGVICAMFARRGGSLFNGVVLLGFQGAPRMARTAGGPSAARLIGVEGLHEQVSGSRC